MAGVRTRAVGVMVRGLPALLIIDALVVAYGTLMAWVFLGLATTEDGGGAPAWLSVGVLVAGALTVSADAGLARRAWRLAPVTVPGAVLATVHLALALCCLFVFGPGTGGVGAVPLVAGAVVIAVGSLGR